MRSILNKIFIFALLLSNCNKSVDSNHEFINSAENKIAARIELLDTIQFKLEGLVSSMTDVSITNDSKGKYNLSLFNTTDNSIQLYEYNETQNTFNYSDSIVFENEGINAASEMSAYLIHTQDSIFVFDYSRHNTILLFNNFGVLIDKFEINDGLLDSDEFEIPDLERFGIHYDHETNSLILQIVPYKYQWTREYFKEPYAISFNLKKRNISGVFNTYPNSYLKEECYYLLNTPIFTKVNDTYVFKIEGSHDFIIYNNSPIEIGKILTQTPKSLPKKIPGDMLFKGEKTPLDKQRKYRIENPAYWNLLYDHRDSILYILYKMPANFRNSRNEITTIYETDFGIMALDHQFEYLGEIRLDGKNFIQGSKLALHPKKGILVNIRNENDDYKKLIQLSLAYE
jgi:hypothetical protein